MIRVKKTTVKRTRRTDQIILLCQRYEGSLGDDPVVYNRAAAEVLRAMAAAVEKVKDAFVDPEIVMWFHVDGEITAQATLSPK